MKHLYSFILIMIGTYIIYTISPKISLGLVFMAWGVWELFK